MPSRTQSAPDKGPADPGLHAEPSVMTFPVVFLVVLSMMSSLAPLEGGAILVDGDADGNRYVNTTLASDGGSETFDVEVPADAYVESAGFTIGPWKTTHCGTLTDDSASDFGAGEWDRVDVGDALSLELSPSNSSSPDGFTGSLHDGTVLGNGSVHLMAYQDAVQVESGGVPSYDEGELVAVAVGSNGYIHVVYCDTSGLGYGVTYVRSTTGGATWSVPAGLTSTPSSIRNIFLYMSPSDELHLFASWTLMGGVGRTYLHSADNGTTWSARTPTGALSSAYDVRLAWAPDGTMHALGMLQTMGTPPWQYYLKYFNSTDGGITWSSAVYVNGSADSHATEYDIAVDGNGTVHAVWGDQRDQVNYERGIWYANSTNGFGNRPVFSRPWVDCHNPRIGVTDTMVHISWLRNDTSGKDHVHYVNSSDSGLAFSQHRRVTTLTGHQAEMEMAVGPTGAVHFGFMQDVVSSGTRDLYCCNSTNDGKTFTIPRMLDPLGTGNQTCTAMCGDVYGTVHLAFHDDRAGDHICYVRADPSHIASGSVSGELDLGAAPASLDAFRADETVVTSTQIAYSISSSTDGAAWSAWEDVGPDDTDLSTPPARHVRWRANMSTADGLKTPLLHRVNVTAGFYQGPGTYVSAVSPAGPGLADVLLTCTGNVTGCDFDVSSDNGTTWHDVSPGVTSTDSGDGEELRYRVTLTGASDRTPVVDSVTLNWTTGLYPRDVDVDLGDDGSVDLHHSGYMSEPGEVDMLAQLRAAQVAGEPTTFGVKVTAAGGGINISGISVVCDLPPLIDSYSPLVAQTDEGSHLLFNVTAHDPDGSALEYEWTLDGEVAATADEFNFSAGYDDAGVHAVMVEVSDGRFSVNATWDLSVADVNRAPEVVGAAPAVGLTLEWDEEADLTLTVADPDGDALSWEWTVDGVAAATGTTPGGATEGEDIAFTASAATLGQPGTYNVTGTADDDEYTISRSWFVTILPPALAISLEPGSVELLPGGWTHVTLTFDPQHVLAGNATVSADPSVYCQGGKYPLDSAATLNISLPSTATPGGYTINISAEAGIASAWALLSVEVLQPTTDGEDGDDGTDGEGGEDGEDGEGGDPGGDDRESGDETQMTMLLILAAVAAAIAVMVLLLLVGKKRKGKQAEAEPGEGAAPDAPGTAGPVPPAEDMVAAMPDAQLADGGAAAPMLPAGDAGAAVPMQQADTAGAVEPVPQAEGAGAAEPVPQAEGAGDAEPVPQAEGAGDAEPVPQAEGAGAVGP